MAIEPQWDENYLKSLIRDAVSESLVLDYKGPDALTPKTENIKKEISKDVSAFANSAGGTIIYGVVEKDHLPVAIDGMDPSIINREWLDQVICSRIQRRIDNLRIYQILLSGGKVAYSVVIPQSDRAPHMASDHRYYKRFEYQSVAMEDYEVRDVANRAIGPRLSVGMSIDSKVLTFVDGKDHSEKITLRAFIANDSTIPAEHAVFHLLTDSRIQGTPVGFTNRQEIFLMDKAGRSVSLQRWQLNWGVPGKLPIWNEINFSLFDSPYEISLPKGPGEYTIGWSVKSPRMTGTSELVVLRVDENDSVELQRTGIPVQF